MSEGLLGFDGKTPIWAFWGLLGACIPLGAFFILVLGAVRLGHELCYVNRQFAYLTDNLFFVKIERVFLFDKQLFVK